MTGWTETTLRAAASWQAFKEGKSLFDGGAVAEAQTGSAGYQGAVKSGPRLIRVQVAVKSPTDFATRCSCAQNRASGEICAHAVAVGLATLAGGKSASNRSTVAVPAAVPVAAVPIATVPWQILLPLNWRDALVRGKLAATLAASANSELCPADDRLNAWQIGRASCRERV